LSEPSVLTTGPGVVIGRLASRHRDHVGFLSEEMYEASAVVLASAVVVAWTSDAKIIDMENVAGESAARARKNLRRDMENKLAEGSRQFLKAFGEVDQVSIPCFRVTSQINQDMCREEIKRATGTC